jgi:hypothetical protein
MRRGHDADGAAGARRVLTGFTDARSIETAVPLAVLFNSCRWSGHSRLADQNNPTSFQQPDTAKLEPHLS